jgi:glycosyltransferase involved in cell wall biosynthesis
MKILFLTDNFPPEVNAPATRTHEHCKEWVKRGANVTVITCVPNFPKGKVFDGYQNKLFQRERIDGIEVIRVWSYLNANTGFVKRILDYISFAVIAFGAGLFQKTDVIIGTSPQFFTAVAARSLSFFKRKPWVMEVRDLWPESIAAVGAMKRESLVFILLEKMEHHMYRSAKWVIVVTDSFKTYVGKFVKDSSKIVVVKNGVDSSKFSPIPKDIPTLRELKLENKFLVGYIGTHGMAHALSFVLDCAKEINDEEIHFILQGDGAEKENLLKKAKSLNLKNVTFLPFVSKQEIKRYISILDVALVNLKRSDTFKTVIPSKIFENACMLKPILLGVEGESKEIIDSYNAGVTFIPENIDSFLDALATMKDKKQYETFKEGCKKLAQDFERSTLANKMLDCIQIELETQSLAASTTYTACEKRETPL